MANIYQPASVTEQQSPFASPSDRNGGNAPIQSGSGGYWQSAGNQSIYATVTPISSGPANPGNPNQGQPVRGAAYSYAQEAARRGDSINPYVRDKAIQEGFTGEVSAPSYASSRQTVASPDRSSGMGGPRQAWGTPGVDVYMPVGDRGAQLRTNAKVEFAPSGAFQIEQLVPSTQPGFTRRYPMIVAGGSDAALQSGMVAGKAQTPIVFDSYGMTPMWGTKDNALVQDIQKNPGKYSRQGSELYGGKVQLLDGRTIQSANANGNTVMPGGFPQSSYNYAGLVNFNDQNAKKGSIANAGNLPAFGQTKTFEGNPVFQRYDQNGKATAVYPGFGEQGPVQTLKNPFLSAYTASPPPTGNKSPNLFGAGVSGLTKGFGGFAAMLKSNPSSPSAVGNQTTTTYSGSNQTIQDKLAWIKTQRPILEGMDSDITTLAKGNTSGSNWTGTPEGYATISDKISKFNSLNDAFKANVSSYNLMDAENPRVMKVSSIGAGNTTQPAQKDMFKDLVSTFGNFTPPSTSNSGSPDKNAAGWISDRAKMILGSGAVVGAVGYGGAGAFSLPEIAAIESNPIGWGATGGGLLVLGLEASGRLGLLGDTKDYSVRTAGYDFQGWLNSRSQPKMMNVGSGSFSGPELPAQRNTYAEIPPFKSTYSEVGSGIHTGNEGGTGMFTGSEAGTGLPNPFKSSINYKIPQENSNKNRNEYQNRNENGNSNNYIDPFGVSYPNPVKTPSGNANRDVFENPFKTPAENPNGNKNGFTLDTPNPNKYETPFNPFNGYNFETPNPGQPGKPNWKLDGPLMGLPSFGLGTPAGYGRGGRGTRMTETFSIPFVEPRIDLAMGSGREIRPMKFPAMKMPQGRGTSVKSMKFPAMKMSAMKMPTSRGRAMQPMKIPVMKMPSIGRSSGMKLSTGLTKAPARKKTVKRKR